MICESATERVAAPLGTETGVTTEGDLLAIAMLEEVPVATSTAIAATTTGTATGSTTTVDLSTIGTKAALIIVSNASTPSHLSTTPPPLLLPIVRRPGLKTETKISGIVNVLVQGILALLVLSLRNGHMVGLMIDVSRHQATTVDLLHKLMTVDLLHRMIVLLDPLPLLMTAVAHHHHHLATEIGL